MAACKLTWFRPHRFASRRLFRMAAEARFRGGEEPPSSTAHPRIQQKDEQVCAQLPPLDS